MNWIKKSVPLVVLMLLFVGCDSDKNPYFNVIYKSDEGQLRGVNIGDNIASVKQKEDAKFLRDAMNDYLHYDYQLDMGNSYTVTYDFTDEDELYEIELAVFFDAIEDAGTLFEDYNDKFNRKFGVGVLAEDGFTIWNVNSKDANIEVAMINDSEAYGFLSIIIRDLNY